MGNYSVSSHRPPTHTRARTHTHTHTHARTHAHTHTHTHTLTHTHKERAIVDQTNIGTVSNATLGKLLSRGGAHMGFSDRIGTIMN